MNNPPSGLSAMIQLKCPKCRKGNMFTHSAYKISNILSMPEYCPHCGLKFEIEPGFYWGAMYVTYSIVSAYFIFSLIVYFLFIDLDVKYLWAVIISFISFLIFLIPLIVRYARAIMLHAFGGIAFDKQSFDKSLVTQVQAYPASGQSTVIQTPVYQEDARIYVLIKDSITGCTGSPRPVDLRIEKLGAPIVEDVSRCGPGMITLTAQMGNPPGNQIEFYSALSGGNLLGVASTSPYLFTTEVFTTTNIVCFPVNTISGCKGPAVSVLLKADFIPGMPVVPDVSRCGSGMITLTAQMGLPPGNQIEFYNSPSGGSLLGVASTSPYLFSTEIFTTTDIWCLPVNTISGCKGTAVPVTVDIFPLPPAPIADPVSRCGPGMVTFTILSEPNLQLEILNSEFDLIHQVQATSFEYSTNITTNTQFLVRTRNLVTGCASPMTEITATAYQVPGVPQPVVAGNCLNQEVSILVNNGTPPGTRIILLEDALVPIDTSLAIPARFTVSILEDTKYYIRSLVQQTGCLSDTLPVVLKLKTKAPAPVIEPVQRCGPGALNITVNASANTNYKLYDTQTGGNLLATGMAPEFSMNTGYLVASSTYYVEAVNNEYDCPSPRVAVPVTIIPIPEPPLVVGENLCGVGTSTIFAKMGSPEGSALGLYDDEGALIQLQNSTEFTFSTPPIGETTTFYVASLDEINNCSSPMQEVRILVHPLPSIPTAPALSRCGIGQVTFTAASQLPVLMFDGNGNLVSSDVTPLYLLPTPVMNITTTYYLQSKDFTTGCLSLPSPAVATIYPKPIMPLVNEEVRCGSGQVTFTASSSETGVTMHVYNQAEGLITTLNEPFTFTTPDLNQTTTYYFSVHDDYCESQKVPVSARIYPIPGNPIVSDQRVCASQTLVDIYIPVKMTNPLGTTIRVYDAAEDGNLLASDDSDPYAYQTIQPVNTIRQYYFESYDNSTGCLSSRVPATITVLPTPEVPILNPILTRCGVGAATFTLLAGNFQKAYLYNSITDVIPAKIYTDFPAEILIHSVQETNNFYIQTFDSASGCFSPKVPVKVVVNPIPYKPVPISDGPVCSGGTLRLSVSNIPGYTYEWSGPDGFEATGSQVTLLEVNAESAGIYNVVSVSPEGCRSNIGAVNAEIITNPPQPIPTFYNVFLENVPLCVGSEINLAVVNYPTFEDGTHFEWRGPNDFHSYPHPFPAIIRPTELYHAGTYYVRAHIGMCTTEWVPVEVPIFPKPNVPQISDNLPLCFGNDDLKLLIQSASPDEYYHWMGPGPLDTFATQLSIPITNQTEGLYKIVATNSHGCVSDTAYHSVDITKDPLNMIHVSNANSICEGGFLKIDLPENPGAIYYLSGPNGYADTSSSGTFIRLDMSLADKGMYYIQGVRSRCTTHVQLLVDVHPIPEPPIIGDNGAGCERDVLAMHIEQPDPNVQYFWRKPDNTNVVFGQEILVGALSDLVTGTYEAYQIVDGCTSLAAVREVTFQKKPQPPIVTNDGPACIGDEVILKAFVQPGSQILWRGPDGFISHEISPVILPQQSGFYYAFTIVNGCTSLSRSTTVLLQPQPAAPFVPAEVVVCHGKALLITASGPAAHSYLWSKENVITGQTQSVYNVSSAMAGDASTYFVQAIVNGCTSEKSRTAVRVIQPIAEIRSNQPVCEGAHLIFTATNVEGAAYLWSGPQQYQATGFSSSTVISSAEINQSGIYSLQIVQEGCTSAVSTTAVQVTAIPASPVIAGKDTVCIGDAIHLWVSNEEENTTYSWRGPSGYSHLGASLNVPAGSVQQSGLYEVRAISNGCTSIASAKSIYVSRVPAIPIISKYSNYCIGETVNIPAYTDANTAVYWSGPNQYYQTGQHLLISQVSDVYAGNYSAYAVANGCTSAAANVSIVVNPIPVTPEIQVNGTACTGSNYYLQASGNPPGTSHLWLGPNGFEKVMEGNGLSFEPLKSSDAGNYTVYAIAQGCTSQAANMTLRPITGPSKPTIQAVTTYCEGENIRNEIKEMMTAHKYLTSKSINKKYTKEKAINPKKS